jgi:hypothetical protein
LATQKFRCFSGGHKFFFGFPKKTKKKLAGSVKFTFPNAQKTRA